MRNIVAKVFIFVGCIAVFAAQADSAVNRQQTMRQGTRLRSELRRVERAAKQREARIRAEFDRKFAELEGKVNATPSGVPNPGTSVAEVASPVPQPTQVPITTSNGNTGADYGLYIGLASILAVLGLTVFQVFGSRRTAESLRKEIEDSKSSMIEASLSADSKLLELLSQRVGQESKGETASVSDHSFYLRVADEVVRIQNYVGVMPPETKGVRHLGAALKRLKDELEDRGYEMVEMAGNNYDRGMNVEAEFKHDPTLPAGTEIITKVKRPQVNYQDKMIQMAEIEVTHNV